MHMRIQFIILGLLSSLVLAEDKCDDIVEKLASNEVPLTQTAIESIQKINVAENPFIEAGTDPNAIGKVHEKLAKSTPSYRKLLELNQKPVLSETEWNEVESISKHLTSEAAKGTLPINDRVALKEMARFLRSLEAKRPLTSQDQKKHIAETEEKKKEDKKDKKDKEKQPPPPPWNDADKEYQPFNKRLEQGDGSSEVLEILRTNAVSGHSYFTQVIYDTVTSMRVVSNPSVREEYIVRKATKGKKEAIISTYGKKDISVPVPYGFEPVQTKGAVTVQADSAGIYHMLSKGDGEVSIELLERTGLKKAPDLRHYLEKSGIPESDWAPGIVQQLKLITGLSSPTEKAEAVKNFIKTTGGYRYYSESKKVSKADMDKADAIAAKLGNKPNVVAASHTKLVNCDLAAQTAAIWLRDFLGVPSRIAAGRNAAGHKPVNGERYDVINTTSVPHMWAEYWNGQRWEILDATPDHPSEGSSEDKEKLDQIDADRKDDDSESDTDSKNEKGKEGKEKDGKQEGESSSELTENGGKELKIRLTEEFSPFYKLLRHVIQTEYYENALEAGHSTSAQTFRDFIGKIDRREFGENLFRQTHQFINSKLAEIADGDAVGKRLSKLKPLISTNQIEPLWKSVNQMRNELVELEKLRDLSKEERDFEMALRTILLHLENEKDPNSRNIEEAKRLLALLPGKASRLALEKQYGGDLASQSTPAFKRFAEGIFTKGVRFSRKIAAASPMINLFLNHSSIPRYRDAKIFERSPVRTKSQDVVIAKNATEFSRFIWDLRPGEDIFTKFARGEQFAIGSRKTKRVIDPKKPLERKATYVFYDVSGSMGGSRAEAVQTILATLADKAASETDSMGAPLHELYFTPFDDNVHVDLTVEVKNMEDAVNTIEKLKANQEGMASNGTNIQVVLEKFYDWVGKRFQNTKESAKEKRLLKKANLVLITDGGAIVDEKRIEALRSALPKELEIYLNFVSIETSNAELEKLAKNSAAGNSGLFTELKASDIEAMNNPSTFVQENEEVFIAKDGFKIPDIVGTALSNAEKGLPDFRTRIKSLDLEDGSATQGVDSLPSSAKRKALELYDMAQWLTRQEAPSSVRTRYYSELLNQYPKITGRKLSELTVTEAAALKKLQAWALGATERP